MSVKDFLAALVLVFFSEMGDKSQIVSFGFGTQYKLAVVLPAILIGIALMMGFSALMGQVAGHLIPYFWMQILSAALFFIFAYMSLFSKGESEQSETSTKYGAFFGILITFLISELGDKTILATMTLASHASNMWAIWLGSTLGMFAADLLAIGMASYFGKSVPDRVVRGASALLFCIAGVWTLIELYIH